MPWLLKDRVSVSIRFFLCSLLWMRIPCVLDEAQPRGAAPEAQDMHGPLCQVAAKAGKATLPASLALHPQELFVSKISSLPIGTERT